MKDIVITIFWIIFIIKTCIIYYLLCSDTNSLSAKFDSWYMEQNALSQSDCTDFSSTIFSEQNDAIALFFAFWNKSMKIQRWLKFFLEGSWVIVINGHGHAGPETVKLDVSQEWIGGINWFLHADTNSGKL